MPGASPVPSSWRATLPGAAGSDPQSTISLADSAYFKGQYVLVGTETRGTGQQENKNGVIWSSADGRTWQTTSKSTTVPFTGPREQQLSLVGATDDMVIVMGSGLYGKNDGRAAWSSDLSEWKPLNDGVLGRVNLETVAKASSRDAIVLENGDSSARCRMFP